MPQMIHTIEVPDGAMTGLSQKGRMMIGLLKDVANSAGGGAGQSVSVVVSGLKNLPADYYVFVDAGQDAVCYVAEGTKTATGFTVTMNPRLAANTLASGSIEIAIFA